MFIITSNIGINLWYLKWLENNKASFISSKFIELSNNLFSKKNKNSLSYLLLIKDKYVFISIFTASK